MHFRRGPSRLLAMLIAGVALVAAAVTAAPALADDSESPRIPVADILNQLDQLQSMQVEEDVCAKCHPNYDPNASFTADIKFSHGYHVKMQCSDCHTRFPHQKSGTQRPTMKTCMNCHGLRHGPQGFIAKANCDACHNSPRARMSCPYSKTMNWAETGHVARAKTDATKDCMMCHTQSDCASCHRGANVSWTPPDGWAYDPGESDAKSGCYACHGNSTLLAFAGGSTKSFQVTGVKDSVHYKITCQQCHPDFRYDATPAPTRLWNVNAGLQCAVCHQKLKDPKLSQPVVEYERSTHAQKLRSGDYDAATCGSCHGGHFISSLNTVEAKARMHASAYRVCARCHLDKYNSFNDYYHGQPYKDGAPDAPACWQCHGAHLSLAHQDPQSSVNPANLGTTCGQPGCHKGSSEQFAAEARQLIHRKGQIKQDNWLVQQLANIKGRLGLE